jgi:hypothetical protein
MLSASVTIGNGARDFKDAVVTARPGRPSLVMAFSTSFSPPVQIAQNLRIILRIIWASE